MRIPCNTGDFQCRSPRGQSHVFRPEKGSLRVHGGRNRLVEWHSEKAIESALILVGLSSPTGRTYSVEDVINIVERVRRKQSGDPSASFITQRGLYLHKQGGETVREDSVRVILLHLTDETKKAFQENVVSLAETLARELHQEEVIVEFQNRGITEDVLGVHP